MHNCDCEIIEIENIPFDDNTISNMSEFLKGLADPTRLKIVALLSRNCGLNVCAIAQSLNMTHSATSHQLSVLKKLRLVSSKKIGKNVSYSLADGHIHAIVSAAADHAQE